MTDDYLKWKKYDLVYDQVMKIVEFDLEPNAASAKEMEGAFELLPGLIKRLKDIYYENYEKSDK